MEQEIETLRFRVDSLKREIEQNSIPFSDTLSENDAINPGGLSFFETEDLLDPSANTDSLLNLWYVQRSLKRKQIVLRVNKPGIFVGKGNPCAKHIKP